MKKTVLFVLFLYSFLPSVSQSIETMEFNSHWIAGFNLTGNYRKMGEIITPKRLMDFSHKVYRNVYQVVLPESIEIPELVYSVDLYFRRVGRSGFGSFSIGVSHNFFVGEDNDAKSRSTSKIFSEYFMTDPDGNVRPVFELFVEPVTWSIFLEKDLINYRGRKRAHYLSVIFRWNKVNTVWSSQVTRIIRGIPADRYCKNPYDYKKVAKVTDDGWGLGMTYKFFPKVNGAVFLGISAEHHTENSAFKEMSEFKVLLGAHIPQIKKRRR